MGQMKIPYLRPNYQVVAFHAQCDNPVLVISGDEDTDDSEKSRRVEWDDSNQGFGKRIPFWDE